MMTSRDYIYAASLSVLFAGLIIQFGLGTALIVLGSIGTGVSVASSFFTTWLASKGDLRATKTQ